MSLCHCCGVEHLIVKCPLFDKKFKIVKNRSGKKAKGKKHPMCLCPDDKALCTIHPAT
jgi:hypothetical protein